MTGPWAVTAAGTVGFDHLVTDQGERRDEPGGSLLYFSLAARGLCQVRAVAAVGGDGRELIEVLDLAGVDHSSVAALPGRSYRWRAEHRPGVQAPLREAQWLGVYRDWHPELSSGAGASQILFLGSMSPRCQEEVLARCRPQVVALDTMGSFIRRQRSRMLELVARSSCLFVNEPELLALLPSGDRDTLGLAEAARRRWGLDALVLKLGPRGAVLLTEAASSVFPPRDGTRVVDPTGAGDALAGGFLGRLAQLGRVDQEAMELAMVDGMAQAARAVGAFGIAGLLGGT
ncbi:MAG: PfkB family carbohydrate kinase [Candidatus Dormibacteria bacterium]